VCVCVGIVANKCKDREDALGVESDRGWEGAGGWMGGI
jgi:hypothetical protein